jgi:mono/diheme cytochrome c family protein
MLHSGITRFARLALSVFLAAQVSACGLPRGDWEQAGNGAPETTYRKFLARAEAGDAESQNVVGFMLYHGEGVRMDRTRAQLWFQRAAAQGNVRAQRNLALLYSASVPGAVVAPDQRPSPAGPQASLAGQSLYERYCAGCHGFNGISAYVHAPSFALGEALEKGDAELMRSVLHGKGEMPNWDDKFSRDQLQDVLRFVRTLQARYELGIGQTLNGAPALFYLFGPMAPGHSAYRGLLRDYGFDQPQTGK